LEKSSIFASIDHSIYSSVTVGDIDNDQVPELIVGDLSGNLYVHRKSGTSYPVITNLLSEFNFGSWSVPRLIDFDYDNDFDLIVANEDGNLAYLENSGNADSVSWQIIPEFFGTLNGEMNCVPYPIDFDKDGDFDLFLGNIWSELNYYRNENNSFILDNSVVNGITTSQNTTPALADLDNDGDFDLIVGNYGGTFDYYKNTSTVDIKLNSNSIPTDFELLQNYPNPFNPSTIISYNIPTANYVKIIVYNSLGQIINTLVSEYKQAGSYNLTFDASNLTSGVYYYRIETSNNFSDVKKMLLVR